MKLPNAEIALVEREKIVNYLLNGAHPDNGGKAKFFEALGFRRDQWETMVSAFRKLAREAEVSQSSESPHGQKYVVVAEIESPSGRAAMLQSVWIVDRGLDRPRLVTAYPHER